MEDDDEFGDLYTDVLRPFATSSSSDPQFQPPSSSAPPPLHRPIDLNLQTDDEEIPYGTSRHNSSVPQQPTNQPTAPNSGKPVQYSILPGAADPVRVSIDASQKDERRIQNEGKSADDPGDFEDGGVQLPDRASVDVNCSSESAIDRNRSETEVKDADLMDKDVKFDIEEDAIGVGDVGSEPIIPGLSSGGVGLGSVHGSGGDDGDDWDSDSDDDLQIVLNDNTPGHMGMERGGMVGDGGEDEDGLVIVADGGTNQATEEQEWGEDASQAADAERKETGETAKPSGGMAVAPKIGYSNHGYHPFHSQFKVSVLYVAWKRMMCIWGFMFCPAFLFN